MTRQTLTIPRRSQRLHHLYPAILAAVLIAASLLLPAGAPVYAAPASAQPAAPLIVELPSAAQAGLAAPVVAAPAAPLADQANLSVTAVAASPTVIVPGGQIQYNVTVTNNGPNTAQNVQVALNKTYIIDANIVGGSASPVWNCETTVDQRTSTCTRGSDLPFGASEMITFLVDPQTVDLYPGTYFQSSVSSSTEDPDTSNNVARPGNVNVTSSLTSADIVPERLRFTPADTVPSGSLVTLRFAARNAGPGESVYTATLNVAAGTQIMGLYDYAYNCTNGTTIATCSPRTETGYGHLNSTPNTAPEIYALLLAPVTAGTYNQQVTVSGELSDPLPGNNSQGLVLSVVEASANADLQVVSAATGPASVAPGATVFYSITVRNDGPDAASDVVVFVPMFPHSNPELSAYQSLGSIALAPTGWDCKPHTWDRGWLCKSSSLKNGEQAELLFRLSAPPAANIYLDKPAIGSATGDPDTSNNIGQAALTVNKSTAPVANLRVDLQHITGQAALPSGEQTKLFFTTRNTGPDSAETAYVGVSWDYYGGKWSYVSHNAPAGWNCTLRPGYDGGMDCFANSLASGANEEWVVKLQAPTVTALTDMYACVLTTSATRNDTLVWFDSAHKFACDEYYVTPFKANLRITGRGSIPVNAGGVLSYTLVVHNDGPDAINASYFRTLELAVAPGVVFQRFAGTDWEARITYPDKFLFYFPPIAAGAATTATIVVLAPAVIGSITATATVRGPDYDVDLSNNQLVLNTRVSLGEQAADLGVALSAPTSICVGATSTATATVNNLGLDLAIQPTVVFTAPVNMAIQSASSADFLCSVDASTSATCTRSSMSSGSSSTIHFALLALSAGNANLQVSVDSDTPDDNQFDNSASATTTVKICQPPSAGKIAYIFNGEPIAADYETLLESRGYTVDLIGLNAVTSTVLGGYDLFLLGDDSGRYPGDRERFTWGTQQATTAAQMAPIIAANKPVIGLGEGGSIYLEKRGLSIGWLNAWYWPGDLDLARPSLLTAGAVYNTPNAIPADPVVVYTSNSESLDVYGPSMSSTAFPIGMEIPDKQHFNITSESCHFGWGFRNGPTDMTADGKNLFHNLVAYAIHFQCPKPPPPSANCVSISKSSNPPHGSQVQVSDVGHYGLITYTLSYNLSANPLCANRKAKLVDVLPPDTELLPGSASDGITADASRALIWTIAPGTSGTKQFTVVVLDSACRANETIHNRARLTMPGREPLESNEVKHQAICSPVIGDNENPPFAQDELQVFPYPIIAGRVHTVSVRLINRTATAQTVNVSFQTSSQVFGIGIPFTPFATRSVTIPAHGNVILSVPATFALNGHYCIQVTVEIPGFGTLTSQRNIDVMEDLQPGVSDVLNFKVGNPLGFATDIALEVDNTCPGFTAVVSPTLLSGMAPGAVRNATLTTTPPSPVLLGSGCHIDIKGYAVVGGSRIPLGSGLRKLDVPPIPATTPSGMASWLSPYISFQHEPPMAGVPNQICIELQNPLPVTKTVTLVYNIAQVGAGIPFTPVATRTVDLPPNSSAKYCIDWTPPAIEHYCVKIEVQLPGWRPQFAQRNVEVRTAWRPDLTIPFVIRNPDLISHRLRIDLTQWGIDPNLFQPVIRIPKPGGDPDPQPNEIAPGQQLQLELAFMPVSVTAAGLTPTQAAATTFGDVQRVDVAVSMDGKESSGLSALFAPQEQGPKVFLPLVSK